MSLVNVLTRVCVLSMTSLICFVKNLNKSIGRELYEFQHKSREPQDQGSSIDVMVIFVCKLTMMLGMQVISLKYGM